MTLDMATLKPENEALLLLQPVSFTLIFKRNTSTSWYHLLLIREVYAKTLKVLEEENLVQLERRQESRRK